MHQETLPRVMPAAFQRYRDLTGSDAVSSEAAARSCFSPTWIVLRRVGGDRLPLAATLAFATAVRGAILKHCPPPHPEVLSGHQPDGPHYWAVDIQAAGAPQRWYYDGAGVLDISIDDDGSFTLSGQGQTITGTVVSPP